MLTRLEDNKRTLSESLELTHRHENKKIIYIPNNMYVIGKMNIADRSLVMIDFALSRRFAFFTLVPNFCEERMLGSDFTIGHSYLTHHKVIPEPLVWYKNIVDSKIKLLLEEYWFDEKGKFKKCCKTNNNCRKNLNE